MLNKPVESKKINEAGIAEPNEALQFTRALFEDIPEDARMLLWQKRKPTIWIENVEQIKFSDPDSRPKDLYIGCGLVPEEHIQYLRTIRGGQYKRCPIKKIIGIPGLWADFDIEPGKIPDRDTAYKILDKLPSPTMIVDSGHGMHIWWLFKELWMFDDDKERKAAIHLSKAWSQYLKEVAEKFSCSLDSVPDLSRVLRVPGTINNKNKKSPVPVTLAKFDDNLRYNPDDFDQLTDHIEIPKYSRKKMTTGRRKSTKSPSDQISDNDLIKKMFASRKGEKIKKLFDGDIKDYKNDSSAADMALCSELGWWTNYNPDRMDKIFRQSKLMRPKWDEKHFSDPPYLYGERTIHNVCQGKKMGIDGFGKTQGKGDNGNPMIIVNRQLKEVCRDTWTVIHEVNKKPADPTIFLRSGSLVRIRKDVGSPLRIEEFNKDSMNGFLFHHADWFRESQYGLTDTKPPKEIVADILVNPDPELPQLDQVASTPFFGQNGNLIVENGYHAKDRTWLELREDLKETTIPEKISSEDIKNAISLIMDDLLVDFPFVTQADRANVMGAFILPFVRHMIDGPTPLHMFEAPTPGSGKTMMANLISIIANGHLIAAQTIPVNEEEIRKKITAMLRRSPPIILLDNAPQRWKLDSESLSSVLTTTEWTDRLLGVSNDIHVQNKAMWIATANNPRTSMEIASRMIRIRIDPKVEQPWERDGFKHEEILIWTAKNRRRLVEALLIIISNWIRSGKQYTGKKLGRFENWNIVIGGILQVAGIDEFLDNRKEVYAQADDDTQMWREFVEQWWSEFASEPVTTKALYGICDENDLMILIRGDKSDRSQQTRLGKALKGARDRTISKYRIHSTWTKNASGNPTSGYQLIQIEQKDESFSKEENELDLTNFSEDEVPF